MFKQRSGVLPTMNSASSNTFSRFAPLNDFSDEDEDEDDGLGAFNTFSRSSSAKDTAQRAAPVRASYSSNNNDNNDNAESDEDDGLRQFGGRATRGAAATTTGRGRYGDEEENSVLSGNLSVGGYNSGEESFSMND